MAKINYASGHGYSSADLFFVSQGFIIRAERDLEHLKDFGINTQYIEEWKEKTQELKFASSFKIEKAKKTLTTEKKNEKLKELKDFIRVLRMKLSFIFTKQSQTYDSILKKALRNMKQNDLLNNASDTLRILSENEDFLKNTPITKVQIKELKTLYTQAKALLSDQSIVFAKSGNSTAQRAVLKEEVYTYMQKISKIGKFYWQDKDPAKYKHYKITPPKKRGRKKKL